MTGAIGAIWGIGGIGFVLIWAIKRLSIIVIEGFMFCFAWHHWIVLTLIVLFMSYSEGYKGFQMQFSPRLAARALYLWKNPKLIHILFAPFFCAAFFHTTIKRKIIVYTMTIGIVILVVFVSHLEQPWRGIIDLGVIVGLAWGIVTMVIECIKAFFSNTPTASPELPPANSGPDKTDLILKQK